MHCTEKSQKKHRKLKETSKLILTPRIHVDVSMLWPEWKDSDLNDEKWEIPKGELFLDAEPATMPRSLTPDRWIRAKDLKHLTDSLTVYTLTAGYPDLITNNKHLLHSEFVRWFISALINLQYCGREGLEISGESSNFVWTNRHDPWHGWLHVYSLNKAGKNTQHRPLINPSGKYIVRLYYMGCWRRILIDDTVPVDKNGRLLLPCISNNFELWPMLLAKALLKIASLTWSGLREIVEFHPITCLTGWTCLTLNVSHLSMQDKWDLLRKYSQHFELTPQTANDYASESSETVTTDKTRKAGETLRLHTEKPQLVTLFFLLGDMRELGSDVVAGLSPCWDHVIYIIQSRDVPLDPKDVKPPLAEWKKHRWLKWAISRNVIDPADYFVPIRYLKVISPLEECKRSIASVYEENNTAGNSIPPSEIEQSDKAARKTRSEKTPDVFIAMKEEAAGDVSRWVDFNKIASYVIEVHLFYKLQYFQHSIQVTDNMLKTTSENHKAAAMKEVKKETRDVNSNNSKFKYKPMYLFCDSLDKKFFLINLCAGSKEKNADLRQKDYLILEKYNWFFGADQSDQAVTISTIGNKSTVVELEAGRQLLRICCHLNSGVAIISSDTSFHLGNRAVVQELMTAESDRIERTSRIISDNLREAYRSFGTKDYPITLKGYYRSYMPSSLHASSKENKNLRMLIHDAFMKEQVRLIKEAFLDEELGNVLRSLRIFFLNPNIRLEYDLTTQKISQDRSIKEDKRTRFHTSRDDKSFLNYDQAATIIQSFFKMALVKKYKQLHGPDDALHAQVRKELLKISDLFDSSLTNQLMRNFIKNNNSLRDLYPCYADFAHVLNIQKLDGVVESIKREQWFPIVRLVVSPRPAETVFAVLELLVDLPRFALRVFSNHNGREITHVMNHVARYEYIPNGYTVFAYGSSEEEQRFGELDWTIRVITAKGEPVLYQLNEQRPLSADTKPPELIIEELIGAYVPNITKCISRWILRATSGSIVSMRLSASYDLAEIRIKVADEKGNVLVDEHGGSKILLPIIILKYPAENEDPGATKNRISKESKNGIEEKNSYYVEAFVLNDSWPLTDIEWMVVNRIKMKNAGNFETQTQFENKVSDETTMRDSKQMNDDQVLESPYWILQVVADAKDAVELYQDKKREQEIALLKESWWSKDSGRSERGKELRDTFLNIHVSKIEPEALVDQNEKHSKIIKDENMIFCLSHARQRRTLKSPGFHHRLLALNLTKYVKGDEIAEQYRIKTKYDDEILRKQYAINIADSQEKYSNYLENLAELMNKQLRRYTKFFRKREENFWKRRASVDRAYESRKVHVESSTPERAKIKEKKKN